MKPVKIKVSHPGSLHGYHIKQSDVNKKSILKRDTTEYGPNKVIKKLTALETFNKNNPTKKAIIKHDISFVRSLKK